MPHSNASHEWLKSAADDLLLIKEIIDNPFLTHLSAFHAQQSIEKSFKALLEFHQLSVPKPAKPEGGRIKC